MKKINLGNIEIWIDKDTFSIHRNILMESTTIHMSLEQLHAVKCAIQDIIWDELGDGIEYDTFVHEADHYYAEISE